MNLQDGDTMQAEGVDAIAIDPIAHWRPPGGIIVRIEAVLESIVDKLANEEELLIPFKSRRRNAQNAGVEASQVRFPGKSPSEAKKFARVLLVLQLSHQALTSGTIFTKRHIYYQHQDLFETQRNVDEIVDDLAFTLGIGRDDLNIVASAKGLFVGCLELRLQDDSILSGLLCDAAISIPMVRSITSLNIFNARWLLVVEKDAAFQQLVRFSETSAFGPGILVTAKGYPDLMTRSFLSLISARARSLPIFVLTDYDPDGINIFASYIYGTRAFEHEPVNGTVPMTWIGIKSSHLMDLEAERVAETLVDVNGAETSTSSTAAQQETLSFLTFRDRKYAMNVLQKLFRRNCSSDQMLIIRHELQILLMLGVKAEIQHIDSHGNLTTWLDKTLGELMSS